MTTRTIESKSELSAWVKLLEQQKLPITVSVTKGKDRSLEQNRTAFMWYREVSEQLGQDSPEEIRAYCKLHFAIPILRHESEEYRLAYDKYIRPLDYEMKLALMAAPIDYPATRLLTTKQMAEYLDQVFHHYSELGVKLTEPKDGA